MTDNKPFFKNFSWEKPEKAEIIERDVFDNAGKKSKEKVISVKYNTKKIAYKPMREYFSISLPPK